MRHTETQLLIIDPQNDFCDLPENWQPRSPVTEQVIAPSLPVAGAHADMQRLASWIASQGEKLGQITLTLDSHQSYDIAHPAFWQQRDGSAVTPFTQITAAQVRAGDFAPRNAAEQARTLQYLDQLEAQGSYTLMVWPLHCEIGSWGHGVHASVLTACRQWQDLQHRAVRHVFKGMNPWTEHYSAIRAEVPDAQDPETGLNTALLAQLRASHQFVIAGEASSHCVRATTEHIVDNWGSEDFSRIVLLTDCMSPVGGFEAAHTAFLQRMHAIGVRCETSASFNL
ncbi:cysteine hydrolase family protein [Comamonas suwonensis]|uniref:Cysteine hydrolase n=1 Tax=Comamonas suwonensis TaxID=2606214 RepID=A0A843BF62_9BURK|nr:cysteine hydrolase [Comamonas suwonensis]MBI1626547.1 cysteine hydrolase [Comamonas suwonensis]